MRTVYSLVVVLMLGSGLSLVAQSQDSAQICVRLYEDRASLGTLDAGDPFITRDVGINLADTNGVIIQTALIDDAPQGSSGRVCFTALAPGQYTVSVVSAAYTATTDSVFVTSVGTSAVPLVFDVGMQRIPIAPVSDAATDSTLLSPPQARFALERVFVAGLAALVMTLVMIAVGAVIYVLFLRRKPQPAMAATNPYMPPRQPTDTYRAVTPTPQLPFSDNQLVMPTVSDEDTGPNRAIT